MQLLVLHLTLAAAAAPFAAASVCNPKLLGTLTYDDHFISGCTGGEQQCMAVCGGHLDIDIEKAFCRGTCVGYFTTAPGQTGPRCGPGGCPFPNSEYLESAWNALLSEFAFAIANDLLTRLATPQGTDARARPVQQAVGAPRPLHHLPRFPEL